MCMKRINGAICCDPRSGIDKYSPTNERKNRVKNTRWRSHRVFFTRFFLEFGVNIWNSAERSSAYCHYSLFFGRHNQQWWIRANIQHFSQYCGAEKRGIMFNSTSKAYCPTLHGQYRPLRPDMIWMNIAFALEEELGNFSYDEIQSVRVYFLIHDSS